jgi:hypothetical protein
MFVNFDQRCTYRQVGCGSDEEESSGMYRRVVTLKWTDVSEVRTVSIIRAMNKPRARKGSLQRNMPGESKLHIRRCENLKSHTDEYGLGD